MKLIWQTPATVLALAFSAMIAAAQDKPTQEKPPAESDSKSEPGFFDDVGLKTRLRAYGISGENRATRYLEYRDFLEGGEVASFELWTKQKEDAEYFFRGKVTDAGQLDQRLDLAWGRFGMYEMTFDWNRIPHHFGFNGETLLAGRGSGNLILSDLIQTSLQGSGTAAKSATNLSNFNAGAADLHGLNDVALLRDRVDMGFTWYDSEPLRIGVTFNYEARDGTRPTFGSFGFGNTVQLLEPIAYTTWGAGLNLTYAEDNYNVGLFYDYSLFENREETLTWDNPFRIVDSTTATAYTATFAAGPSVGRMALESDNDMHHAAVRGGVDITEETRLTGEAAWTWRSSATDFLPYTTNTAIKPGAANLPPFDASKLSSLPFLRYSAAAETQFYQLNLTSRLDELLDAKFFSRYRDYDDRRKSVSLPGYVRTDAVWEPGLEFEHFDRSQATAGTSWTWRLPDLNSRLKPGYQFDLRNREGRQVSTVHEHTGSLGLDTEWTPEVSTNFSASRGWRDGGRYNVLHTNELSLLRMFDQSDRVRDEVIAGVRVTPIDEVEAGFRFRRVAENYEADFGLRGTELNGGEIDLTVTPNEMFNAGVVFGYDRYRSRQGERQWIAGGLGDPATQPGFSFSDIVDDVHSDLYALQFRTRFEPEKDEFWFTADYTYAWNRSAIDISSPVGTAANDNNPFVPLDLNRAENSDRHSVHLDFEYRLGPEANLIWGYGVEIFENTNFYNRGMVAVPVSPTGAYAGAYLLTLTDQDYDVHTFYVGVDLHY